MKESKKSGWFRKLGGKTNDFSLFCPASPGGKLATKWRQVLEEVRESSGGLIQGYVAEKSGIPLSALLFNNQPGEKDHCGRDDCNPCRRGTTRKLSCRKVSLGGMVYTCTLGQSQGGRSFFSGSEHERSWLLRLSRNCFKVEEEGGQLPPVTSARRGAFNLFTPGSLHSFEGNPHLFRQLHT